MLLDASISITVSSTVVTWSSRSICQPPLPGKEGAASVLSKLTRHLPQVLRWLRHGLHRRAEPGDAALRLAALHAARALHKAGIGGDLVGTVGGMAGGG